MKLTKKERIILVNQYKILAALYPNESDRYKELVEILENGFKVFYPMVDEWLSEEMSEKDGNLVLEILDFYKLMEEFKERNPEIKDVCNHRMSTFRGFDGNSETEHMFFARFLINTQGKFQEQKKYAMKTDNYNSYVPMLGIYKKIIAKWNETGKEYEPTDERLLEILNS